MNELEYILTVVSEEAVEVSQRCAKAMRFGISETQPGHIADNEARLWQEVSDLQGALEMLVDLRGKGGTSREAVDQKKLRVAEFMRYSESLGCLQRSGNVAA